MQSRKIDYKNKNKYGNYKNPDSKKGIIIRYSLYLLLIIIISFVIGFWISSNNESKINNDSNNENNIVKTDNYQVLLILEKDSGLSSVDNKSYTDIFSYALLLINSNRIIIITIPPSTEINNINYFPHKIFNDSQYYSLISDWNSIFKDPVITNLLIVNISDFINKMDFLYYDYIGNDKKNINPFIENDYDYLVELPDNFNQNQLYNLYSYHSFYIKEIIESNFLSEDYVRLYEDFDKKVILENLINTVNKKTILFSLNPIEYNNQSNYELNLETISNNYQIIKSDVVEEFIPYKIKTSVRNATEEPINISSIVKELSKFNIEVVDYKNSNLSSESYIINHTSNLLYTDYIGNLIGDIEIYGSIFDNRKDFEMILYIGKNYNQYFNFDKN